MMLRSRIISNDVPKESSASSNPRQHSVMRAPPMSTRHTEMVSPTHDSDEELAPPVIKRLRRGSAATQGDRKDFMTPVFCQKRHARYGMASDESSLKAVRNIFAPSILCKMSTEDKGLTCTDDEQMSPEQCFFGYNSISAQEEEEEDDDDDDNVFNPYCFIKHIQLQSQQLKRRSRDIPVKTRSTPRATLVLDLDETLVFSSLNMIDNAEYTFHIGFQDHSYKVFLILRPHVHKFLETMSKIFEMFVYTSAKKQYAEKILEALDPQKKLLRHRLYQEDCTCVLGHYVKDLDVLRRDLAKTVVLDNAPHAFPYHLMNTIPIKSWAGDREDDELLKLIPYLEKLSETDDFRQVLKWRMDHIHRLLSED